MNLNQLHYFVTLAYMEHYTKAAKQLSITQPSLSHAIGMLEQELGTYLFEKTRTERSSYKIWKSIFEICRGVFAGVGYRN